MMLELRNIYKTYAQGKLEVPVLKNISLSVAEGEYVAIMGPSGSGKTTLMNIIGCLDNPTSGQYLLEGEDLAQHSDTKMSDVRLHSIGFVFQSFYLLSRQSALENVALPLLYAGVHRKERLEIARKALERVGLGDRTEFKPTQLSGGQCQRVAIARAIVNSPKILLADEPTGALDTKSGEQIMDIFQKLNSEGVTIVMITHEPEIAAHAQRTLHIRDGRLMDENGRFLSPEEPEPQEEPLPEDVIPAKEFLTEPLEPKDAAPKVVLPVEVGTPFHKTASLPEELSPRKEKAFVAMPDVPEPAAEPQEEPEAGEKAEEPLDVSVDYPDEAFLDAEISALLDAERPSYAEEKPVEPPMPAVPVFETGNEAAPLEASAEDTEESAPEEEFFDIDAVSEAIDEEESEEEAAPILVTKPVANGGPEQISFNVWDEPEDEPDAREEYENAHFEQTELLPLEGSAEPVEEAPADGVLWAEEPFEQPPQEYAVSPDESAKAGAFWTGELDPGYPLEEPPADDTTLVEPYSQEQATADAFVEQAAEEDTLFDTAFDAVEEYEPAVQEDDALQGAFQTPLKLDVDLSDLFGSRNGADEAEAAPVPEDHSGRFGAPIRTDLDVSLPVFGKQPGEQADASVSGGFQKPIKIELDSLGLGGSADSPATPADREDNP